MRIIIDCFKLIKGSGKSIGIYNLAVNLVRNLALSQQKTGFEQIRDAELIVAGNQYNREDFEQEGVSFIQVMNYDPTNKLHCIIWELFGVSSFVKKQRADRAIFPRGFCALTHPVKDTVIIHDMIPFYYHEHYPKFFNTLENAYIMNRLKASALKSDQVITISEASKKEIIKYCKKEPSRINVIYNGCNPLKYDTAMKKDKEHPYICAITSRLPHKNAKNILMVYEKYYIKSADPLPLKVIGISDDMVQISNEKIKNKITCYKYIKSDDEMHRIIAGASAFLFLSNMEGFGFPPVEAMQLHVPVICSNRSSLPEITGDAAILVDPDKIEEIACKLDMLLDDQDLQKNLVCKGMENIKRFYWDGIIKKYWDAILEK